MLSVQPRLNKFLDKRIPAAREFSLNHRSIFIFPSRFGALYLLLCIGMFLLGSNYQNNLMIILCYFLLSLFLLNLFVSYLNFARLHVQLGKTHNGFAHDTLQLPLWFNPISTKQSRPHGMLHIGFYGQPSGLQVDLDKSDNPNHMAMQCEQRGKLELPRITINSYYPLGLFRCWTHLAFESDILIYPAPIISPSVLTTCVQQAQETLGNQGLTGHDDFDALAAYRPGEPLHHVAWKQLAKGRGMITKQFTSPEGSAGWLTLHPVATNQIELRLSQLCFQVLELSRTGQTFGLDLGQVKIPPQHGPNHQQACLQALALYPAGKEQYRDA